MGKTPLACSLVLTLNISHKNFSHVMGIVLELEVSWKKDTDPFKNMFFVVVKVGDYWAVHFTPFSSSVSLFTGFLLSNVSLHYHPACKGWWHFQEIQRKSILQSKFDPLRLVFQPFFFSRTGLDVFRPTSWTWNTDVARYSARSISSPPSSINCATVFTVSVIWLIAVSGERDLAHKNWSA